MIGIGILLIIIALAKLFLIIKSESNNTDITINSGEFDPETISEIAKCIIVADGLISLLGGLILICI